VWNKKNLENNSLYSIFRLLTYIAPWLSLNGSLGEKRTWVCGFLQYLSMYGTGIAYTITTSISMRYINVYNLLQLLSISSYFWGLLLILVDLVQEHEPLSCLFWFQGNSEIWLLSQRRAQCPMLIWSYFIHAAVWSCSDSVISDTRFSQHGVAICSGCHNVLLLLFNWICSRPC